MQRVTKLIGIAILLFVISGLGIYQAFSKDDSPPSTTDIKIFGQSELLIGSQASIRMVVVDYKTEMPVPDVRINISLSDPKNKDEKRPLSYQLFIGHTDASGTLNCLFMVPDVPAGDYEIVIKNEAEPTKATAYPVKLKSAYAVYLSTDKPIYQPGQEMHIRALALHKTTLKPITDKPIVLEVLDSRGNKVMKKNLATSKFGIASSIFSLADEINMGSYTVRAIVENEPPVEKTVNVDKYVLPRFKISFNTDKKFYLPKETVKCTLRADYTYGKPVANAKVTIKASTFDYQFRQFGEWTGSTDAKGETAEFTFTLPDYFVGQPLLQGKGMVKFDILVIDDTDHKEDAANTVTVTDASINIAVIPESGTIVPGIENVIYIAATYPDGSPAKNTKLTIDVANPAGTFTPSTDELGIAPIKLTPAGTGLTLKVSARDEQGNKAEKIYAFSVDPAAGEDGLLIRADKSLYKVGETLILNILSTRPNGPVYADFVKDKQTVLTKTVELRNGQGRLEFSLTPELFGVLEINAYQIRKSLNIIRDTARVFVSPAQELAIRMTPNKPVYLPGEDNVSIDFAVTLNNQPVLAALGIWAVDEAVFAKAEQDPGLAKVFFMLEKEVMKPRWEIHDYSLDDIIIDKEPPNRNAPPVGDSADAARKQLAARVLFAAVDELNSLPVRLSSRQKEMEKELGEKAVRIFTAYSDHLTKFYPEIQNTDLKQLITRELVKNAAELQDPWGTNYILVGHSHLHSFGPDKTDKTADDIDIAAEGFRLKAIYDDKTTAALFAQYKLVTAAIAKYRALVAVLTKDLHGLTDAELVKPNDMLDPWGTAFIADLKGECGCEDYPHNNEIASAGPDKKLGTGDDIRIMSDCSLQGGQLTPAQQDTLKAAARKIINAITAYKGLRRNEAQVTGDYSAIYKKGLLKKDQTTDPWGNTIFWLNDQQLLSVGKDGKKDTPDDLLLINDIIQIKELPDSGLSARLQAQVQSLKQVIQQYYQARASRELSLWAKEGLLKPDDAVDPWGYQLSFQGYYVLGHRPDATAQTGPDWTVTYYVTIQREDEKKAGLIYGQGSAPRGRRAKGDEKKSLGDIPIIGGLMPKPLAPQAKTDAILDEELPDPDTAIMAERVLEEFKEEDIAEDTMRTMSISGGMGGTRSRRGGRRKASMMALTPQEDDAGGGAGSPRLRQDFRETLFVLPQLITNELGIARYTMPRLADNITDWRISTFANSLTGHLGSSTTHLKSFQDFFIDADLPVALTQNDELSVPVIIKNYLKTPQRIVLSLKQGSAATAWFTLMDKEDTRTIDIGAESGKAEYFRIRARDVGRKQPLQFEARAVGSSFGDAVLRYVEVKPDGKEFVASHSETISSERLVDKTVTIPEGAITGASAMFIKLYPGVFAQVLEGMEKILQMPSGCFEQTSSTTYPNILAMDYLKSTSQSKPEIELQARTYISHGYQRLLSFEVQGGGFEWFGHAPANQVLTAYGLMEFADMAKVFDEVDPAVINRTTQWLMSKQQPDGSWQPDAAYLHAEAWGRIQGKNLLVTAYIAWSLAETGYRDAPLTKALDYIKSAISNQKSEMDKIDPYILGLCANALLTVNKADETGLGLLKYLDDTKVKKDKTAYWKGTSTVTYASGQSADIETTAMIALAFLKAQAYHETLRAVLDFITQSKDPNGTWHSTQGTILALKALLKSQPAKSEPINAEITVLVNNQQAAAEVIDPSEWDVVRTIDLRQYAKPGDNNVHIKFAGKGAMMYQLVGRYYLPVQEPARTDGRSGGPPKPGLIDITVDYDRTQLTTQDILKCTVKVSNNQPGIAKMIIVDLSQPPGFSLLDQGEFAELVGAKKISKFSQTARQVILYLDELAQGKPLEFVYHLKAKYPLKVQAPSSRVYEYYDPAKESFSKPATLEVK